MKFIIAVACLLAAATVVRGTDQETILAAYMEYLLPDIKPCADQFNIAEGAATNIQTTQDTVDMRQMGCMKACVMKRMSILTGNNEFHLEPIMKMISVVHAGDEKEITDVKKIATECSNEISGENDECNIGNKYTDCYVNKLFNLIN